MGGLDGEVMVRSSVSRFSKYTLCLTMRAFLELPAFFVGPTFFRFSWLESSGP
jgi:hypothetical protein